MTKGHRLLLVAYKSSVSAGKIGSRHTIGSANTTCRLGRHQRVMSLVLGGDTKSRPRRSYNRSYDPGALLCLEGDMAGYSNRDWVCLRKWRYDQATDAKVEAERLNASPRHIGEFHEYKCPYASGEKHWHVGRLPGRRYA